MTAACSSFWGPMGASVGGEAGLGSDKDLVPGRRGISCEFVGGKTTVPAVPGWDEEEGSCSSSKEQRHKSGLFAFQRGHIRKM